MTVQLTLSTEFPLGMQSILWMLRWKIFKGATQGAIKMRWFALDNNNGCSIMIIVITMFPSVTAWFRLWQKIWRDSRRNRSREQLKPGVRITWRELPTWRHSSLQYALVCSRTVRSRSKTLWRMWRRFMVPVFLRLRQNQKTYSGRNRGQLDWNSVPTDCTQRRNQFVYWYCFYQ